MSSTSSQLASAEQAIEMGLTSEEFNTIKSILGRVPNFTEMRVFSALWSEHCSHKNSIKWLYTLPKEGSQLLVNTANENTRIVDLGDGMGCSFKIESNNHACREKPYQGAVNGVCRINRAISAMGARPVAQLNSLRFGNITSEHSRRMIDGVVRGIGDCSSYLGVPMIGGEVSFDESYEANPLVNVMSVGLIDNRNIISSKAMGVGNPVF
ncbi:MAG: phosphoribosylformylglycinamidine synthase subunit PurL, partial [Crocinitomicaceae bacterium]|nr:phosphoribosylformylglycinamidine synthase subunit PurL [Crocinitomicaceae bacterium]